MKQRLVSREASLLDCLRKKALEQMGKLRYAGHDETHAIRVEKLCAKIAKEEEADLLVAEAAALLHDIGRGCEQEDPKADHAEVSARMAERILGDCGFPEEKIPQVLYAIRVHRFSQGEEPSTLEAEILQDADRIDISGVIGAAMAFAYGAAKNMKLYDQDDPLARRRELDDDRYVLDHFQKKLLKLGEAMHTKMGKEIARRRQKQLVSFVKQFHKEITLRDCLEH